MIPRWTLRAWVLLMALLGGVAARLTLGALSGTSTSPVSIATVPIETPPARALVRPTPSPPAPRGLPDVPSDPAVAAGPPSSLAGASVGGGASVSPGLDLARDQTRTAEPGFAGRLDALPLRALGLTHADARRFLGRADVAGLTAAWPEDVYARLEEVNARTPLPFQEDVFRASRNFECFAVCVEGELTPMTGWGVGRSQSAKEWYRVLRGTVFGRRRIAEPQDRVLRTMAEEAADAEELARRELWTTAYPALRERREFGRAVPEVAALYVTREVGIIRWSDDPDLTALIRELEELQRSVRVRVQEILQR